MIIKSGSEHRGYVNLGCRGRSRRGRSHGRRSGYWLIIERICVGGRLTGVKGGMWLSIHDLRRHGRRRGKAVIRESSQAAQVDKWTVRNGRRVEERYESRNRRKFDGR